MAELGDATGDGVAGGDGSSSNDPLDDDDENRRDAFEQDPERDVPDTDADDDGSTEEVDTGDENRREAVEQEPDIPQGPDQTDTDEAASGREDAVDQDPGSDPVERSDELTEENRVEAVEETPEAPQDDTQQDTEQTLGYEPGQSASERGIDDLSQDDADELRKQASAGVAGLGPSDFELFRDDSGDLQARLSEEGLQERASATDPTLDTDDFEVSEEGVSLTTAAREERFRADVSRELGVSQEEVTVVRDREGNFSPFLTEEAERTAIENQLAEQENINREEIETVEQSGRIRGRLTEEAVRERVASQREDLDPGDVDVETVDGERQVRVPEQQAQDEQFGDFAINLPGGRRAENVLADAGEAFSEQVAEPAGDAVGDIARTPARFATIGAAGASLAAERAGLDTVSEGFEEIGTTAAFVGERAGAGLEAGGRTGVELLNLPETARIAKEGVELGGFIVDESLEGDFAGATSDVATAGAGVTASGIDFAFENPNRAAGGLTGGFVGGTGAIRAAQSAGRRSGRAVSAAIQPGEELAGAVARRTRIPTSDTLRRELDEFLGDDRGQADFSQTETDTATQEEAMLEVEVGSEQARQVEAESEAFVERTRVRGEEWAGEGEGPSPTIAEERGLDEIEVGQARSRQQQRMSLDRESEIAEERIPDREVFDSDEAYQRELERARERIQQETAEQEAAAETDTRAAESESAAEVESTFVDQDTALATAAAFGGMRGAETTATPETATDSELAGLFADQQTETDTTLDEAFGLEDTQAVGQSVGLGLDTSVTDLDTTTTTDITTTTDTTTDTTQETGVGQTTETEAGRMIEFELESESESRRRTRDREPPENGQDGEQQTGGFDIGVGEFENPITDPGQLDERAEDIVGFDEGEM